MEREYQKARENQSFRQEFLDQVDLGPYKAYVSKVKYSPKRKPSTLEFGGSMWNDQPNPLGWFFKGFKSIIGVNQSPFLQLDNPYDFLNVLLYHEGEHAKQRFENPTLIIRKRDLMERLAWENQLKNLDSKCSPRYQAAVLMQVIQISGRCGLIT